MNLQQLGFTPGEERVYLSLLKLGTTSSGKIAEEAQVSRSKVYEVLDKLAKKGLVGHHERNGVQYFQAAHPSRISDFLNQKQEEFLQQKAAFEKMLPFLENTQQKQPTKDAEVFEGTEGIKQVRELALKQMAPNSTMIYFGNPSSGHEHLLGYWDDWNARRVKKKINAKIIYNHDAKEFGERRTKLAHTEVKYLPDAGKTPSWVEIYDNTVAIVLREETPMAIVVTNPLIAESFRTYFNVLWNISKK